MPEEEVVVEEEEEEEETVFLGIHHSAPGAGGPGN